MSDHICTDACMYVCMYACTIMCGWISLKSFAKSEMLRVGTTIFGWKGTALKVHCVCW